MIIIVRSRKLRGVDTDSSIFDAKTHVFCPLFENNSICIITTQ